jgi:hypothetical protein
MGFKQKKFSLSLCVLCGLCVRDFFGVVGGDDLTSIENVLHITGNFVVNSIIPKEEKLWKMFSG